MNAAKGDHSGADTTAAKTRILEWSNAQVEDRVRNTRQNALVLAGAMLLIWTAIIQVPLPSPAADAKGNDKSRTYSMTWAILIGSQSAFAVLSIVVSIVTYMTSGSSYVPPDSLRVPDTCPHCKKPIPSTATPRDKDKYDEVAYQDLLETQLNDLRRTAGSHKYYVKIAAYLGGAAIILAGCIAVRWAIWGPVP